MPLFPPLPFRSLKSLKLLSYGELGKVGRLPGRPKSNVEPQKRRLLPIKGGFPHIGAVQKVPPAPVELTQPPKGVVLVRKGGSVGLSRRWSFCSSPCGEGDGDARDGKARKVLSQP